MAYDVVPVVKPDDLEGQKNGFLDMHLLTTVPNGQMHHLAANAWVAMCMTAAKEAGVVLTPSSGGDSYRSYDAQERGFRKHYTLDVLPGRPTKDWKGKTWYLNPGYYEAARPGQSNHGLGLAIDVAGLAVDPVNEISKWVLDNYARFGFSHEHKHKNDPPHIRYFAGDAVPAEVAGRKPITNLIPAFDPENGVFSLYPLNPAKDFLSIGSEGDLVRYAQGVFRCKLGYATEVTGRFDDAKTDFVNWFKVSHKLEANGIIGTRTWALIDIYAVS